MAKILVTASDALGTTGLEVGVLQLYVHSGHGGESEQRKIKEVPIKLTVHVPNILIYTVFRDIQGGYM